MINMKEKYKKYKAGDKIGTVTLVEKCGIKHSAAVWKGHCDCGKDVVITPSAANYHNQKFCSQECGLRSKFVGQEFGDYKILKTTEGKKLLAQCKRCGTYRRVQYSFIQGKALCKCNPEFFSEREERFEVGGESLCVSEWARRIGVSRQAMFHRLSRIDLNNKEQLSSALTGVKHKYHKEKSVGDVLGILENRISKSTNGIYVGRSECDVIVKALKLLKSTERLGVSND